MKVGQKIGQKFKGRSTTTSGRNLQFHRSFSIGVFGFSPVIFPSSPDSICNLVRKSPQNMEKMARAPGGEKCIKSWHVSGCQGHAENCRLSFVLFCLLLPSEALGMLEWQQACIRQAYQTKAMSPTTKQAKR